MEIKFYGNTCFEIKGQNATVLINPEKETPEIKTDIVLSSKFEPAKKIEGASLFDWPGEYEVKEIPISAYPVFTKSKSEDEDNLEAKPSIIFCFTVENIRICHLGYLGHSLKSDLIKDLGDVDILMMQAGAETNLSIKKATEIIENIEPRILIIMGENMEELLKARSLTSTEPKDKLVLKSEKELPENDRLEIVLKQHS